MDNKIDLNLDGDVREEESTYETCPECGALLPEPEMEDRGAGYFELVTYCRCGANFIN